MSAWYQKQKKGSVDMAGHCARQQREYRQIFKNHAGALPDLALQRQRQPRVDEKLRQQHRRLATLPWWKRPSAATAKLCSVK